MTKDQKDTVSRITWPLVALVGVFGGFFVGVFALIPKDMPEARTALLGFLTSSVGAVVVVVVQRLAGKVEQVNQQTNGNMSALLASKTLPDVSRETSGPRHLKDPGTW